MSLEISEKPSLFMKVSVNWFQLIFSWVVLHLEENKYNTPFWKVLSLSSLFFVIEILG